MFSKESLSTLPIDRNDFDVEDERVSNGRGEVPFRVVEGLVPERFRLMDSCLGVTLPEPEEFCICVVLSCAADTDGRSFRGVIVPLMRAVISSPLADGPADAKCDPFWDLVSVDAVP